MLRNLIKYTFKPSETTCWNCKSNDYINRFICGECKYLKSPALTLVNTDYFQLFDLEPQARLDVTMLENKYRNMQKNFHPDRYYAQTTHNNMNLNYSQEYSSFINEAYNTLKNEISRAEYLLQMNGFLVKESTQLNDLEFMEEMLEKQSQVEEECNLDAIDQENNQAISDLTDRLQVLLNEQHFKLAFNLTLYLRYRVRLRDQISLKR